MFDALRAITVDRYSEITGIDNVKGSDYDSWKENGSVTDWAGPQMALSQKKTYQEAKSMVSSISQSANLDILNDDDLAVYDNAIGRAQVTAALEPLVISPDLNSEGKNPKSFLEDQFGSVYKYLVTRGVNAKSAQNYSDYINSVEDPVVEGWYKTGSRFVARDQIAQLHAGEMVLTASNAEALRQIDANGLQGALSTMKEIASASPVEDTTTQTAMSNLIVASINSQTETLGNYLMTIVGYLSRLSPASSVNADNTAQLSEALLTYAGV